ncbi:hypothetical protein C8R43DRAFT_1132018 [Mycena crocata]|nr:hypothetical protein C8R43DRAFT_1140931 [Mycena crocata]KAJ7106140.1 hypothetical protein C8R43DRAFT_1140636 [Mycena crocata]KAJ7138477.1 hypothetical protein C8R43DRAFT_1132018 [Mycena crocata]
MPRDRLTPRRGRSGVTYNFARQVLSAPIRSQFPYAFADSLAHQNDVLIWREEHDPVYRGDVRPQDSATLRGTAAHTIFGAEDEEDQLCTSSDESDRPLTPLYSPFSSPSPLTPTPSSRNSGPPGPLTNYARQASPTMTELFGSPHRIITYSKVDKQRAQAVAKHAKKNTSKAKNRFLGRAPTGTRQSARIRKGLAIEGVFGMEQLVAMGHFVHGFQPGTLTPVVDKCDYVMGIVVGAPKDQDERWVHVIRHFGSAMGRLYHSGYFPNFGKQEARVRFGIGFGEWGAKPHHIIQHPKNFSHVAYMQASGGFKEMCAYHNHLYQQIAPKLYARQAQLAHQLKGQLGLRMPYLDSVFTTCEVAFVDVPGLSRTNFDATLEGMEALTVGGNFTESGIAFWDDETVISLRPGGTVLFPSGTKRFSFVALKPNETMYVFRQFCCAGAVRWLQKGNRSDSEFDESASQEEIEDWAATRDRRGQSSVKLFSKVRDIYVF